MKYITIPILLVMASHTLAGPYAPAAGQPDSTAISKDDPAFVAWATGCTVVRGLQEIDNTLYGYVTFGTGADAVGLAKGTTTDVVSLGDGGMATLTFDQPIYNGPGYDFAVFENGFSDNFLELAYVEVSSNGKDFFRFPSVSLTQTATQVAGFGNLDPTNIYDLAGKYQVGYGTPFDLSELDGISPLLNVNRITHVRIVDVVGCIQDQYARYDSQGNKINDPWPTPFNSSGFDLGGVGVINQVSEAVITVHGTVVLDNYSGDPSVPVAIKVELRGTSPVMVSTILNANGQFTISNVTPGTYDVAVKACCWLQKVVTGITVSSAATNLGTFELRSGDVDGSNAVDSTDLASLLVNMDALGN